MVRSRGSTGSLLVIRGPMFSGKTKELIWILLNYRGDNFQVFVPALDSRGDGRLVSHDGVTFPAVAVETAEEILERVYVETRLVVIDEVQFLGDGIVTVCNQLIAAGMEVVVAGLDMDFRRLPFRSMHDLSMIAGRVSYTLAACAVCDRPAVYTQRLYAETGAPVPIDDPVIVVDGTEGRRYEPRCVKCHQFGWK